MKARISALVAVTLFSVANVQAEAERPHAWVDKMMRSTAVQAESPARSSALAGPSQARDCRDDKVSARASARRAGDKNPADARPVRTSSTQCASVDLKKR